MCTIIAKNYLPAARLLMESVKDHHPEFARFVLLVDEPDGYFDPDEEDFVVTSSAVLDIPGNPLFHFKYSVLEVSTAVKPHYLHALFARPEIDKVLYFDPDILLFDCLEPVLTALEDHNIVLTPHLTDPLDDGLQPGEHEILVSGAYNLGFIGVRRSAETLRFLEWWEGKLANDCISDIARNLFVDQRWVDLVPGMFADVAILRDPGLNVAYWNLPQRTIRQEAGRFLADDVPLRFFHFSGFRADYRHTISKYQDRYKADLPAPLGTIVEGYRSRLIAEGFMACKDWPYAYGRFRDGSPIPDICRRIIRDDLPAQAALMTLDWATLGDAIVDRLNAPWDDGGGDTVAITRLAHEIYRRRHEAQVAFPQLVGAQRHRFAAWFVNEAARQYGLPWALVSRVATSLDAKSWQPDAPHDWARLGAAQIRHNTLRAEIDALARSRAEAHAVAEEIRGHYRRFGEWSARFFADAPNP